MLKLGNVLLVGGAGFIGSHFLDYIENKCDSITVVDDFSAGKKENIENHLGEITLINEDIINVNVDKKFDSVFIFAAIIDNRSIDVKILDININIVKKSLEMLSTDGIIYFMSSGTIYGGGTNLSEEINKPNPKTLYGLSKVRCEELIISKTNKYFILRLGNVFGERQNHDNKCGIISIIKNALICNKKIKLYNHGKNIRDYIYVKEVVNACFSLKDFGIYNVAYGVGRKTIDIVNYSGVEYDDHYTYIEEDEITLNIDKIKKTGWSPVINVFKYLDNIKLRKGDYCG